MPCGCSRLAPELTAAASGTAQNPNRLPNGRGFSKKIAALCSETWCSWECGERYRVPLSGYVRPVTNRDPPDIAGYALSAGFATSVVLSYLLQPTGPLVGCDGLGWDLDEVRAERSPALQT